MPDPEYGEDQKPEPKKGIITASKPRGRKGQDDNPAILTTRPSELRRHNISDEELEMLKQNSTDGMSELFWGLVGVGAAAVPPSIESLWKAYADKPALPISLLHLTEIVLLVIGIAGASLVKALSKGRSGRLDKLIAEIRAREAK